MQLSFEESNCKGPLPRICPARLPMLAADRSAAIAFGPRTGRTLASPSRPDSWERIAVSL